LAEDSEMRNLFAKATPGELLALMERGKTKEAAELLSRLIAKEREMRLLNILKPYEDKVPRVLRGLKPSTAARILDHLPPHEIKRALFDNYTRLEDELIRELLTGISPIKAARVIERMSIGIDAPREMARILQNCASAALGEILGLVNPLSIIRLMDEMEPEARTYILGSAPVEKCAQVLRRMLSGSNAVRMAQTAQILRQMEAGKREKILAQLEKRHQRALKDLISREYRGPLEEKHPREAKLFIEEAPLEEVVAAVQNAHPEKVIAALKLAGTKRTAEVLSLLAHHDPELTADLLEALNLKTIVRFRKPGEAVWEVCMPRAAEIIGEMDLADSQITKMLRKIQGEDLEAILERLPQEKREFITSGLGEQPEVPLPLTFELLRVGRGRRRTKELGYGIRWIRIEEELDTGEKVKPVLIDLLEMEPEKVRIVARMAVGERAMPAARVAEVFEPYRKAGKRPDKGVFARLGLVQLSKVVEKEGAFAGINGNFYFDYGHYINAIELGIDIARVPGLFFGDPIGWFVSDGRELIPPSFNRAACVVTRGGRVYIEKVFMTDVTLSNGYRVVWDAFNAPKEQGKIILYNSLFGYQTGKSDTHVDLAIARGRIWVIAEEGGVVIPLTGFVLSIPREKADAILAGVKAGDEVKVGNNFPASWGEVAQAMACGPHLVRGGQLDLSFEEEDFGKQDSTVISFFLPRTVETYEAARSFMMLRDDKLIVGTVSGTAMGYGAPKESGGMTFGELAQLALDLGADHAYALDGGGSSSLVARVGGRVRVLNIPTGGADVRKGEERFINTYWLFFIKPQGI